jgi:protein-S-isoprenylcysteine O-methyltransferase Ste14
MAMKVNLKLLFVEIVFLFGVIGLALFLAAGTLAWPAGWAFLILFLVFTLAISTWLLRTNPGLLTERMTGLAQPNQKPWDRVFYLIINLYFVLWLVSMPLDAVRFGWTHMPGWLQGLGAAVLLASFPLFFLVFQANPYLSPAVRDQSERGQRVVSSGPYRVVRHPMYATAILFLEGTALLLGSWVGVLLGLVMVAGIAYRAVQEEAELKEELEGYEEYMQEVRYRMIPYVW